MSLMRSSSGLLVLVLALTSCGPPKRLDQDLQGREKVFAVWVRSDVSHVRRVLPAPVESVWRVLPPAFQFLRIPGTASQYPDEYVYATPQLKIEHRLYEGESNSLYIECGRTLGGSPIADEFQVIFAIMTRLTPQANGGTEIDIVVDGTAQDMTERSHAVRCYGTGRFEEAIIARVEAALRSAKP
jgi:hypothetical protein